MSIMSVAQNLLNKFCQQGVADRANFLKNIAVIGWVLSSLAQTCAIIFNDKIPSKEKRFLIPQEILDGIVNCTLFWFISSKATNLGKKLILNKKILPASIAPLMKNFKPVGGKISQLKEAFMAHVLKFGTRANVKEAEYAIEGMGVLTGIVGAILSNNVCTPLIRNKLAGIYQKRELQKIHDANLNPYFGQIDYSKYGFGVPAPPLHKHDTFAAFRGSGSMRI